MELNIHGHPAYAYTGGRAFDPALPAVVLVHGAANDHSVWTLQARWLAHHGHAVLAPDLPGHGRSAGAALESVEAVADWIVALLDAAGVGRAWLVGHSMGSLAALDAAGRHPDRAARLSLVGCAYPMPVSTALLDAARDDEDTARNMINHWSLSAPRQIGGAPVPGTWLSGISLRLMERAAPGVLATDLSACNAYAGGEEAMRNLACPVQFILGERDQMTPPRAAQALIDAAGDACIDLLPGCGHALMAEQPDAVTAALRGFAAG